MTQTKIDIRMIDASGTADNTTYLRGDGSWETPAGGGGTFWVERTQEGEVYTATLMYYRAEDAVTLTEFVATLGARPEGQNFTIQLNKNGTLITGTNITITTAASASNGVYTISSGTISESISAGDVLTVVITQVGSTFTGADLTAMFKLE